MVRFSCGSRIFCLELACLFCSSRTGQIQLAVIPRFFDCTEELHGDWTHFRELFLSVRRDSVLEGHDESVVNIPLYDADLAEEAARLYRKWAHKLAKGNEDYPLGSADFYHRCHYHEQSEYCLYGHVAALAYLAKYASSPARTNFAHAGLRLLHWNQCLDFLESSSWGISFLDLWDLGEGFTYPQVSVMHQHLLWGLGYVKVSEQKETQESDSSENSPFWIFEFGTHRALSNEPVSMITRALPRHHIIHENFIKPYEGRAEAFQHPFPRDCSPNCRYQQDNVPYTFPVMSDMPASKSGFHDFIASYLKKTIIRQSSVFLCTNPIYYCSYLVGLNKTIIGYFGLPLLYMVPYNDWDGWLFRFAELAKEPTSMFVANNALLAEQIHWQSNVRVRVIRPMGLYLKDSYNPIRNRDILVPEPREACVLNCLLHEFTPSGYPFQFFQKADTDRTFQTFSTFRAAVIFPHDYALMLFYEFYAIGIPLFLPSHLSKYIFPYSATVPLLDWVPKELAAQTDRPQYSPLSLTSSASVRYWSQFMDFFIFRAVQFFPSFAGLFDVLLDSDFKAISEQMKDYHASLLSESAMYWENVAEAALAQNRGQLMDRKWQSVKSL